MIRFASLAFVALAIAAPGWGQQAPGPAPACAALPVPLAVYFEAGQADLAPTNAQMIQAAVGRAQISGCPIAAVAVEAHVDNAEALAADKLDARRAQSVAGLLQASGLGKVKIAALAVGATKPTRVSAEGAPDPLNRRVMVTIYSADALAASLAADAKLAQAKESSEQSAKAILDTLADPARCGGPAPPKDRACAAVIFAPRGYTPKKVKDKATVIQLVTGIGERADSAAETKVMTVVPYDAAREGWCPKERRAGAMGKLEVVAQMFGRDGPKTSRADMELVEVRGWAENEAIDKNDPRRISATDFKLERCWPAKPPKASAPAPSDDPSWGEPAAKVLAEFGLVGDFSDDCSTPLGGPSHFSFVARGDGSALAKSGINPNVKGSAETQLQFFYARAQKTGPNEITLRGEGVAQHSLPSTPPLIVQVTTKIMKSERGYRLAPPKPDPKIKLPTNTTGAYTYPWMTRCG